MFKDSIYSPKILFKVGVLSFFIVCVNAEWVKLPTISNVRNENVDLHNIEPVLIKSNPSIKELYDNISVNNYYDENKIFLKQSDNVYKTKSNLLFKSNTNSTVTKHAMQQYFDASETENDSKPDELLEKNVTIEQNEQEILNTTNIPSKKNDRILNNNVASPSLSLKSLTEVIRSIQENIFSKVPNMLKDKMLFLKNVRDSILMNIEDRINLIWPQNTKAEARGSKGDSHMDFPSAESALMTIGFLTFAVFLIKLVMQVIASLKAKKMMMMTPMVTSRAAPETRNLFGLDHETTARIIQLMEDFKENT